MKCVLVTGATGFLGSALVTELLKLNIKVVGVGRRKCGYLTTGELDNDRFIFINKKLEELNVEELLDYKIDTVFHLASTQPAPYIGYEDFYRGNVVLSQKVMALAEDLGVIQIIYSSSTSFMVPLNDAILSETSYVNPADYYGLTKFVAEQLFKITLQRKKIKVTVIRFPILFGKSFRSGIIHKIMQLAKNNQDIELYGCEKYRNIMYITDAVDILIQAYKKSTSLDSFELFMVGSRNSLTMKNITEVIINNLKSKSRLICLEESSSGDYDIKINISKAMTKLDVKPLAIEDCLLHYLQDICNESVI